MLAGPFTCQGAVMNPGIAAYTGAMAYPGQAYMYNTND